MFAEPKIEPRALEAWNQIVQQLQKKIESPFVLPNPPRGRYIKFAYAADGSLALPRGRGRRIKPHRNLRKLERQRELAHTAQNLFQIAIQSKFRVAQQIAAETSPYTLPPLTRESMNDMRTWAILKSHEIIQTEQNNLSNAARRRQSASRRINSGTIAGNQDRAAHSHS